MHDFPPVVPEFDSPPLARPQGRGVSSSLRPRIPARDFSHPDTTSPSRFVGWILWQQASTLLLVSFLSAVAFLPGSIGPYLVGRIIDEGVTARDLGQVGRLTALLGAVVVAGIGAGIAQHTLIVRAWLVAMYGVNKLVARKTTQMGHVQNRRTPAGEVLSVSTSDSDQFGALSEVVTRAIGALVAYLIIAGIVLSTSVQLGIAVLVAAPVLVLSTLPALKPLHRRQEAERTRSSELTSLATDIVAGLRILRGIGGERTFAQNYVEQSQRTRRAGVAAGNWQAGLDGLGILLSGLFLVVLTWLGARQVSAGTLTVGQLVSFFGYAIFVVWPIRTFFELAQKWVRCLVSARKTIVVLGAQPPWLAVTAPAVLPAGAPITDAQSGFVAAPGRLTVVVSALPDDSSALADRLGRFLPTDHDPISLDLEEGVKGRAARTARAKQRQARQQLLDRDREMAERPWGVTVGAVDLAQVEIAEVRRHILVSDTAAQVFAGTLQSVVDPHGRLTRAEAESALRTASGEDVFDALPGGWQGRIDERGRGLSGGQRQRVVLARALAADPEILVLVEPTSAVDAHTEALIADRLTEHRRGRTTVVMTVSPLLLHHADEVAFMADGRVAAVGTHQHLLRTHDGYRRVVARTLEDDDA